MPVVRFSTFTGACGGPTTTRPAAETYPCETGAYEAVPGRTRVARALSAWRAEICADMGGEDALSAAQLALLELTCRQKVLLDSIDNWLLQQPSLINKRKRSLLPVVGQRQALANALETYLSRLGYERVARPITSATDLVHAKTDGAAGGGAVIDVR